ERRGVAGADTSGERPPHPSRNGAPPAPFCLFWDEAEADTTEADPTGDSPRPWPEGTRPSCRRCANSVPNSLHRRPLRPRRPCFSGLRAAEGEQIAGPERWSRVPATVAGPKKRGPACRPPFPSWCPQRRGPTGETWFPPFPLHHVAHAARHPGTGRLLLRRLGDDRLGGQDVLGDRRGVLQRRADDHRRIGDPRLDASVVRVGF